MTCCCARLRCCPASLLSCAGSSLVGLGTAPEGIEQNPVVFDLVNELPFRWGCALVLWHFQRLTPHSDHD